MQIRGAGHLFLPKYRKKGETAYRAATVWWWKRGRTRVSTGCRDKRDAEQWALERLAEMGRGSLVGIRSSVLTFADCIAMLRDAHALEDQRAPLKIKHLEKYFAGWKARDITEDRVRAYAAQRRRAGAAVATVNSELGRLRRALRLAWRAGRLDRAPTVPLLRGANVRRVFLEPDELEAILAGMPEKYRPPVRFLRATGWRLMEALRLEWRNVDRDACELRLDTSKNAEPRCVPYGSHPELRALLDHQWNHRQRLSPWVFPGRGGRALNRNTVQGAWKKAREKIGSTAVIHDLRRSFVRDCERSGIPRSVAMSITGHKSEAVYRRYAITSVNDQSEAMEKLSRVPRSGGQLKMFGKRP